MRHGFPFARPGMCIGLLGGSFDPAHEGHAHISREALKRLGLNEVWWLVSPGNPLKSHGPAPLSDRMRQAHRVMAHPKVRITDLEARMGTRYTFQTIAALMARYPGVHFVWLMGADNLADFHHWDNWRGIMETLPIAVLARPGQRISARMSVAARQFRAYRMKPCVSEGLAVQPPPAWVFLNVPMNDMSSSTIRAKGTWSRD